MGPCSVVRTRANVLDAPRRGPCRKSARTPSKLGRGDGAAASALGLSRAADERSKAPELVSLGASVIDVEDVERSTVYLDLRRLSLLGFDLAVLPCPARMMVLAVLLTASRSAVSAMCEYRWVVR